jgi:hypothetical protein
MRQRSAICQEQQRLRCLDCASAASPPRRHRVAVHGTCCNRLSCARSSHMARSRRWRQSTHTTHRYRAHVARRPTRHDGIPHGVVSHAAWYHRAAWSQPHVWPARQRRVCVASAWTLDLAPKQWLHCPRLPQSRHISAQTPRRINWSPVPHLRRDWAHPCHICTGTGPTHATSAPGPGSPRAHLHRNWARACRDRDRVRGSASIMSRDPFLHQRSVRWG